VPASLSVMAVRLAVRWSVRDHICVRSLERSAGSTASNHGQYEDGTPITNGDIEALADEAGQHYDVDTLLRRRRGGGIRWVRRRPQSSRCGWTPN